jgi:predicted  nucleic acid-binding Zn-ribbon protein
MSDGACELLSVPPFDYEKEPLVTSKVKLNTDNLKKAVRWLVACAQDQQQTLARHGKRLDDQQYLATVAEAMLEQKPQTRSTTCPASGQRVPLLDGLSDNGGSEGWPAIKQSQSEGFRTTLSGELLDMKIAAVSRQLEAELPRMTDFESERSRMLDDVTSLQRDLTKRFQDADKRIHAELATTTSKLFEQLSRIRTDVLCRIETLENRVGENTDALGVMQQTVVVGKETESSSGGGPQSGNTPQRPTTPGAGDSELSLGLPTGNFGAWAPSSIDSFSRPDTRGTVGAESILEEGSVASTDDSRQPPWKPTARAGKENEFTMPDGIGSWSEMRDSLAGLAAAQRQALEDLRHDLTDMGSTLQTDREERSRMREELDVIKRSHMNVEGDVHDPMGDSGALPLGLQKKQGIVQDLQSDLAALRSSTEEAVAGLQKDVMALQKTMASGFTNQPAITLPNQEDGGDGSACDEKQNATDDRPSVWQPIEQEFVGGQQQESARATAKAQAGKQQTSLKNLIGGAVNKITDGHVSNGVQDESPSQVKKAFMQEASGWLHHDSSDPAMSKRERQVRPRFGVVADGKRRPDGQEVEASLQSDISGVDTSEAITLLHQRISTLEGATNSRTSALEQRFDELRRAPSSSSRSPESAGSFITGVERSSGSLEARFHELQERVEGLERMPSLMIESHPKLDGDLADGLQSLRSDMNSFADRTKEIFSRLSTLECRAGATPDTAQAFPSSSSSTVPACVGGEDQAAQDGAASPGGRQTVSSTPRILDAALDKHPADLSHLMDPDATGGQTPLPFVSKRSLQQAVEGLTEHFRNWLEAIYQSIITALQNKADSAAVDEISKQVQEAACRASESVSSFARRALGGRCVACDTPLPDESMMWRRPAPSSSSGSWMPKPSLGAQHAIRPPSNSRGASRGSPLPACGASKLPKLQDLRQSDLDSRASRDFPKGKVFKTTASDPQLRILRQTEFS